MGKGGTTEAPTAEAASPAEAPAAEAEPNKEVVPEKAAAPEATATGEDTGEAPPAPAAAAAAGSDNEEEDEEEELGDPNDIVIPLSYIENEDGSKSPLKGVLSIFVTETTKKIVNIDSIGPEKPMMKIAKSVVMEDIRFRGVLSDFEPVKKELEKSKLEEFILQHNEDDIYGDGNNLEVCTSEESAGLWSDILELTEKKAALIQKIAEREAKEKAGGKRRKKKKKKRVQKPWESLGSEQDILDEKVTGQRETIDMVFLRPFGELGQTFDLSDKDASELWNSSQMECRPFKDPNFELVRMEKDVGVQAIPESRECGAQATKNRSVNAVMQYKPFIGKSIASQGSGPSRKFLQKTDQDEEIAAFLDSVKPLYEKALQQNELYDIFEDKFGLLAEEDHGPGNKNENSITEFQSFTYWKYSNNKVASCIDWVPGHDNVVAVAITEPLSFNERLKIAGKPRTSYILIWSFTDPIHPQYVLASPFDIYAFQFNPYNKGIVAAGCYNGQVIIWNVEDALKQKKQMAASEEDEDTNSEETNIPSISPAIISSIDKSHSMCITDLVWMPRGVEISGDGKVSIGSDDSVSNFIATTSVDGRVLFWDTRAKEAAKESRDGAGGDGKGGSGASQAATSSSSGNTNGRRRGKESDKDWRPTWSIGLVREQGGDLASTKLSFNLKDSLETAFFAASMDGEIAYAEYHKPDNVQHPEYTKMTIDAHFGAISTLQRSPFFEDIVLSVGEWSFKIWKEGLSSPIFVSASATTYLTMGCWSPTRPGVIITGREDGMIEVWDLLDRSHEASMVSTVSPSSITSLKFYEGSSSSYQLLAAGDSMGKLHILELPRNLRRPIANEKEIMQSFCERELERVQYVGSTVKTFKTIAEDTSGLPGVDLHDKGANQDEQDQQQKTMLERVEKSEQEYLKLEKEYREKFNLDEEAKNGIEEVQVTN